MFTGIVECMGTVLSLATTGSGARLVIDGSDLRECPEVGQSVAVNGVCLTVVQANDQKIHFDLGPETLRRTNLGDLRPGDRVNLETALRAGEPLGGHFVLGHVDGTGTVDDLREDGEYVWVWFRVPTDLTREMVPKGSVAVDGVSLTIVDLTEDRFSVMLIPHTLKITTLGLRRPGDRVNIETDILGKYVLQALRQMDLRRDR